MIEQIKKNCKLSEIMKYIGFLVIILLISSIYYASAISYRINKIGDNVNPFVTVAVEGGVGQVLGIMNYSSYNANDSIISTNIKAQNSANPAVTSPMASISSGTIEGRIFEDLNANGIRDLEQAGLVGDEVVLPGWQINLIGTDIKNKHSLLTTTTDSNGNYYFSGLAAGNYSVNEVLPSGWVQTSPLSSYNVTITSSSDNFRQDFGNFHKGYINGSLTTVGRYKVKKIEEGPITKSTFEIVGERPSDNCNFYCQGKGRVEYQDNSINLKIKSIKIDTVATTLDKRRGVITGLAKVNGAGSYPFVVYVEDNSETDLFDISLPTYRYSNRIIMSDGNIQLE